MSIRLRKPGVPGKYYIIMQGDFTNKKGRPVKQRLVKFDGSPAEARIADAELNNRPVDSPYPSILEILPRFLAAYQNNTRKNTYAAMEGALKHLLPYYGDMRIPLIFNYHHETYKAIRLAATYLPGTPGQTPDMDTPEQAAKRKPLARSSINRELACLNAILTYAKQEKITVESAPVPFSKRQSSGKKIVPLTPSQLTALLRIINGPHMSTIMLMIYCGLRLKEATGVKREDIHIGNRTLYVIGKGGESEPVEIPVPLIEPLKTIIGDRITGLLSMNPQTQQAYGDISKALNSFCKAVGITRHVNHHALRHSCATALVLAGVPLPVIQGKLRHSEIKTTMLYVEVAARFGQGGESKIARELFWLNDDGTQKEAPTGLQKITAISGFGVLRPDTYPKEAADITDILTADKPA